MKDSVRKFIVDKAMIVRGDTIWVALSGGADSSSLLYILNNIKNDMEFSLKAVHINHMLRGDESKRDEIFCEQMCENYEVELFVYQRDVNKLAYEKGLTVEQAGRLARYNIFSSKCDGKVALGHNQNDNAETMIMNLLRGTGTTGLCGIKAVSSKYIRPLLKTARSDIENFCEENTIDYITDSSNDDLIYFRNAIRLKAIPLLNEITGKNIVPILDRAMDSVKMDNDFIEQTAIEYYKKLVKENEGSAIFDNNEIVDIHPAVSARIIRKTVEMIKGDLKDIESRHIALLFDMFKSNKTGDAVDLPGGIKALVQFGKTIISSEKSKIDFEYCLAVPGKVFIAEKNLDITAEICGYQRTTEAKSDVHYFSLGSCEEGFCIRNRRNGDIIKPLKGNGTVKLKKYFIDKKIDRYKRNEIMLMVCGQSVAYIRGMDYGKDFIPVKGGKTVKVMFKRR